MSGHTPGPWGVAFQDSPLRVLAQDDRRTIICTIEGAASNLTCEADAVLIAAAPALVDALDALLRFSRGLGGCPVSSPDNAIGVAEAAIRSAGRPT